MSKNWISRIRQSTNTDKPRLCLSYRQSIIPRRKCENCWTWGEKFYTTDWTITRKIVTWGYRNRIRTFPSGTRNFRKRAGKDQKRRTICPWQGWDQQIYRAVPSASWWSLHLRLEIHRLYHRVQDSHQVRLRHRKPTFPEKSGRNVLLDRK